MAPPAPPIAALTAVAAAVMAPPIAVKTGIRNGTGSGSPREAGDAGQVETHGVGDGRAGLAVEAQEGTDAMLRRVADLPPALRGSAEAPQGVLAKAPKPIQDRRIDMPTIGLATVQRAAKAGLAGIVGEAGGVLVLDREQVIAEADALGLFILGVAHDPS